MRGRLERRRALDVKKRYIGFFDGNKLVEEDEAKDSTCEGGQARTINVGSAAIMRETRNEVG